MQWLCSAEVHAERLLCLKVRTPLLLPPPHSSTADAASTTCPVRTCQRDASVKHRLSTPLITASRGAQTAVHDLMGPKVSSVFPWQLVLNSICTPLMHLPSSCKTIRYVTKDSNCRRSGKGFGGTSYAHPEDAEVAGGREYHGDGDGQE